MRPDSLISDRQLLPAAGLNVCVFRVSATLLTAFIPYGLRRPVFRRRALMRFSLQRFKARHQVGGPFGPPSSRVILGRSSGHLLGDVISARDSGGLFPAPSLSSSPGLLTPARSRYTLLRFDLYGLGSPASLFSSEESSSFALSRSSFPGRAPVL